MQNVRHEIIKQLVLAFTLIALIMVGEKLDGRSYITIKPQLQVVNNSSR